MEKEFVFEDELFDEEFDQESESQNSCSRDRDGYITEEDFYPPSDNRVWKSNIEDIDGGDNFADFCEDFFERLEEENYFNN